MHCSEPIFVHPKVQRHSDHLEAVEKQVSSIRVAAAQEQSICKEKILEMLQPNKHPRIDGFDLEGWVV
jgi:hypothetical protein